MPASTLTSTPIPAHLRPNRPCEPLKAAVSLPACVNSTELFKGQKSVGIEHNGSLYRLQATKLGKLILTK